MCFFGIIKLIGFFSLWWALLKWRSPSTFSYSHEHRRFRLETLWTWRIADATWRNGTARWRERCPIMSHWALTWPHRHRLRWTRPTMWNRFAWCENSTRSVWRNARRFARRSSRTVYYAITLINELKVLFFNLQRSCLKRIYCLDCAPRTWTVEKLKNWRRHSRRRTRSTIPRWPFLDNWR